ncbi:MAG: hypothetical protein GXO87_08750 [Chlorobi bacterium]|nr:hypothetical protein [Chlorobiota bacterium]
MKLFNRALIMISIFVISSITYAQSNDAIAKFDDTEITVEQFRQAFVKNENEKKITKRDSASLTDFLNLYVNYRMKLADAHDRGYDSSPETLQEIENYKKEIGVPYYIEKHLTEAGMKDLHAKRKYELRVSHILIRHDTISTAEAVQLADSLIKEIQNGADFAELAKKYSGDTYSKENGGDIYYITAGQVIPEFEEAAYQTKVGEVYPKPIKTKYGVHILKVTEKKRRIPQIKASHILVMYKNDSNKVDTTAALEKIKMIQKKLKEGADFAELAKKYSDDKGSAKKGGDLGYFQRRMMVKPFDEAVFKMKNGEISDIVQTKYGFHIIKVTDIKDSVSYDDEKGQLRRMYEKSRFQKDYSNLIEGLKAKTNFVPYDTLQKVIEKDSGKTVFGEEYWNSALHKQLKDLPVCSINGKKIYSDSLFKFVQDKVGISGYAINKNTFPKAYKKFTESLLIYDKVKDLEKTDPEFAQLMKDYRNGILIFKLQDAEVWNKLKIDSVKVKQLWEETKADYNFPDRVSFYELYAYKKADVENVKDSLKAKGMKFPEYAAKFTKRKNKKIKNAFYDTAEVDETVMGKEAWKLEPGRLSEPFKASNGWVVVMTTEKFPSRQKTFEEAKPEATSVYQEMESKRLEKAYEESLREKYHPEIYYEKIGDVFANEQK